MAASSPIAAFLCGPLRSPIFRPARGTIVVGRFDHFIRCAASSNSNSTFDRCPSSSELKKPFALATIFEATLKELWAGASAQHRTAARKVLLLLTRRVVFTIGDLLNKGTAVLTQSDDGHTEFDPVHDADSLETGSEERRNYSLFSMERTKCSVWRNARTLPA